MIVFLPLLSPSLFYLKNLNPIHKLSNFTQQTQVMAAEFDALLANNTWQLVPPPPGVNIGEFHWVYKVKQEVNDSLEHSKAWLVAQRFRQQLAKLSSYKGIFSDRFRYLPLSFDIQVSHSKKRFFIDQSKYAMDLLHQHGIENCKPVSTMFSPMVRLVKDIVLYT